MVVAEYSTPTNVRTQHAAPSDGSALLSTAVQKRNEVVLWDLAVRSPQEAKLNLQNVFNKYALIDQFDELRCVAPPVQPPTATVTHHRLTCGRVWMRQGHKSHAQARVRRHAVHRPAVAQTAPGRDHAIAACVSLANKDKAHSGSGSMCDTWD